MRTLNLAWPFQFLGRKAFQVLHGFPVAHAIAVSLRSLWTSHSASRPLQSLKTPLVPAPVEGHVDSLFSREAQHTADYVAVVGTPAFVTHLRPAFRKPDFNQALSHRQGSPAPLHGWSKSHLLHLQLMLHLRQDQPETGKESQ